MKQEQTLGKYAQSCCLLQALQQHRHTEDICISDLIIRGELLRQRVCQKRLVTTIVSNNAHVALKLSFTQECTQLALLMLISALTERFAKSETDLISPGQGRSRRIKHQ